MVTVQAAAVIITTTTAVEAQAVEAQDLATLILLRQITAGNANPGDANVNVSVNNQSRTTKVSTPAGNTANRQANNATNNSRYTNNNSSNSDSRSNSRTDNSSRETSGRNTPSTPARNNKPTGNGGNITVNQTQVQNAARNAASMPGAKSNTSHTTDRSSSSSHDGGRDTHSSNQQRTQNTSRPPLSRNTSGGRTNIPAPSVSSAPHTNQSVVNTGGGTPQGNVTVNAPSVKTGSKGVTVPVMPQTQGVSRTSGSLRTSDNRSVNNNAIGNSSVNSDSDVHTFNVSSDNGRTDRRSTVIAGGNRTSSNVSGGSVNNITSVREGNVCGGGTVVNNAGTSYSEHGGNSHYVANTNMSTTERRVKSRIQIRKIRSCSSKPQR